MGTFKHQCFQVHFDFAVPVFSTGKKYHAFSNEKVVTAQFDRGRWYYAPMYAKWLPLKETRIAIRSKSDLWTFGGFKTKPL